MHSKTISRHIINRLSKESQKDALHGQIIDKKSEEYLALETYYDSKYFNF